MNNLKTSTLTTTPCFNPYFVNGKQISRIVFFADNEIKVSLNSGWFDHNNNDHPSVDLPFKITRKNKIDLTVNHGFTMKDTSESWRDGVVLYLPLEKLTHSFLGEKIDYETDTSIKYKSKMEIDLFCTAVTRSLDDNDNLKYGISDKKIQTVTVNYGFRSENTDHGDKCDKIAELFKSNRIDIAPYQIDNMLKLVDINIK